MTNGRSKMMSGAAALAMALAAVGCGQETDDEATGTEVIASAAPASIPKPPGVPDDYVATPNGWRHKSCVIEVGADETVGPHHLERAGGGRRAFGRCQHPAYDRAGAPLGPPTHEPQVNGWVASINSTAQGAITSLGADWIVPPTPSSAQNQTLFFFPGVEPAATGDVILQPVLAWNGFGDHAWTIASWACCKDGNVFNSSPVGVASGHKLTGTLAGVSCSAGVCANWTITTRDDVTAQSTTFAATADGEQMSWVFGGAMEILRRRHLPGVPRLDQHGLLQHSGAQQRREPGVAGVDVLERRRLGDTQLQPAVRKPAGQRPQRDDLLREAELAVSVGEVICGLRVHRQWTRRPLRHTRSGGETDGPRTTNCRAPARRLRRLPA